MKNFPGVILLIPSAREFDRGLRRGIVRYAQAHGPWTFFEEAPAYLQALTTRKRMRSMRAWNADGIVLLQERLAEVKPLGIPMVVAIGRRRLGRQYCQIRCDNVAIGRLGAETFLGLRLRNFAYCGVAGHDFSDHRAVGFTRAVREAGFDADIFTPGTPDPGQSWYADQRRLAVWLRKLRKPVGLMACNDDRGRMLGELCRVQGIRVPDEVAILGVDNDEQVCSSANPPLSSIALATELGGYEAAAHLDHLMRHRDSKAAVVTIHPTHVVSRQSTDTLAVEDQAVVRALQFIRANVSKDIRVGDLPAAAGISRRALQDRFKRLLGRSPKEEVHRSRVERIARLLVETNMTVSEIAEASGFEIDAHVSRFFSRHTGLTPLEFRRKNRVP